MDRKIFMLIVLIFAVSAYALAATPETINYQGYLKQGGVVVNGTKSITFNLYDASAGGAQLCSSGAQSVTIANGLFSYKIGSSGCDLKTINWDNAIYLEIVIDGVTMSPREQIAGMSYLLQTKAMDVMFTPAGNVAATTAQAAIEEIDTEKVSKGGDTMTGVLTAAGFTTTGNATAALFIGDGSGLTNLSLNAVNHNTLSNLTAGDPHTQYAKKSGDTFTGNIYGNANILTAGSISAATGAVTAASATFTGQISAASATFTNNVYTTGGFYGDGSNITNLSLNAVNHNTLSNLTTGDPHTQYAKKAGDTFTGNIYADANILTAGNITAATGTVTANTASITGAVAANTATITGTVTAGGFTTTGNATAAYLFGDGSNITNISGTAVNHNTLNNLTTGDPHTQYAKKAGDTFTGNIYGDANILTAGNITAATGTVTANTASITGAVTANTATITGTVTAGSFTTTGNATAAYLFGDGSNITNISGTAVNHNTLNNLTTGDPHTQYAKKAGDTFTGNIYADANILTAGSITAATGTVTANTASITGAVTANTATITGTVTAGGFTTTGNATAAYLFGNGANITNISAGSISHNSLANLTTGDPHAQYVAAAGDSMTGALAITMNSVSEGINVIQNGTGAAGAFQVSNAASNGIAVYGTTNGTGSAVSADCFSTTCKAGFFYNSNAGSTSQTLRADNAGGGTAVFGLGYGSGAGVQGSNTGTGRGGHFEITGAGNTSDTLYITTAGTGGLISGDHTGGSGNLLQLKSAGVDKIFVSKAGQITAASASFTNNVYTAGGFYGDGSNITNISAASISHNSLANLTTGDPHTQYVTAAGDTFTGAVSMSGANGDITFDNAGGNITLAGGSITDSAGNVNINDNTSVTVNSASTGIAVTQSGSGRAASFTNSSAGNANYIVYATSNGTNSTMYSEKTGAGQAAGIFQITNAANPDSALVGQTSGGGNGVLGVNSSTGPGLAALSQGTGRALQVESWNGGNASAMIWGNHSGAGNLMQLQKSGVDKFVVSNSGAVTATSFSGDGSALTSINAGSISHNSLANLTTGDPHTQYVTAAGDTMTGALSISASSGSNILSVTNTNTSGDAIYGITSTTGGSDSGIRGLVSGASGYGVRGTASGGGGSGVYGEATGSGPAIVAFQNSTGALFKGNTSGSGNLLQLQQAGVDKFVVSNSGAVTATSFSGDGSALTNIVASSVIHNSLSGLTTGDPHTQYTLAAGDTFTGALSMSGASGDITFDNAGGAISNTAGATLVADDLEITGAASVTASTANPALSVDQAGAGNILRFSKSGTNRFIIDNSGNVGFNVTSPSDNFHFKSVSGQANLSIDTPPQATSPSNSWKTAWASGTSGDTPPRTHSTLSNPACSNGLLSCQAAETSA